MKKILLLMSLVIMTSCGCLLSQIPPQTIYVGAGCEAPLPAYQNVVNVSDNCPGGLNFTQIPAAGTLMNVSNPLLNVELFAVDAAGNKSNTLIIPVLLVDTVAPILEWPIGQIAAGERQTGYLWQNTLASVKANGIAPWLHNMGWTQGLALADTAMIMEQLHWFFFSVRLSDEELDEYEAYVDSR